MQLSRFSDSAYRSGNVNNVGWSLNRSTIIVGLKRASKKTGIGSHDQEGEGWKRQNERVDGYKPRGCFGQGNEIIAVKFLSNEFMKRYTVKPWFNNHRLRPIPSVLSRSSFSVIVNSRRQRAPVGRWKSLLVREVRCEPGRAT